MKRLEKHDWPKEVRQKVEAREEQRAAGNFEEADRLRGELWQMGYELRDEQGGVEVWVEQEKPVVGSWLGLFGSGETMASGGLAHEMLVKSLGKRNVTIALVATPAGFQPNVEVVYGEIAEYLQVRLQNYHPQITLVKAYNRETANDERVIEAVTTADYIFTGPGSPTYAVKELAGTKLLDVIFQRVETGVALGLASSAVIAFSHFCLPVYEIYKVGAPLSWFEGLNGYEKWMNKRLTVVPHFNNTEGGKKTDTSRCFVGRKRFERLVELLPVKETVWGIDEQTAVVINLATQERRVLGSGGLHMVLEGN